LISNTEGIIQEDTSEELITSLKTIHSFQLDLAKGKRLAITIDNASCPGVIYLLSDDKFQVFNDYLKIRKIEAEGLYKKATAALKENISLADIRHSFIANLKTHEDTSSSYNSPIDENSLSTSSNIFTH